jgi:hypothetical protein
LKRLRHLSRKVSKVSAATPCNTNGKAEQDPLKTPQSAKPTR